VGAADTKGVVRVKIFGHPLPHAHLFYQAAFFASYREIRRVVWDQVRACGVWVRPPGRETFLFAPLTRLVPPRTPR